MQLFNERGARYAVADFYAGIAQSTFDMNVKAELQECMVRDDGLTSLWDSAISDLSQGREDKFKDSFREAMERTGSDLAHCGENAKLSILGHQLDSWWENFWGQGDDIALGIYETNRAANKGKLL